MVQQKTSVFLLRLLYSASSTTTPLERHMTINNTSRSDLSETATKVHSWKRESFGLGYDTDRFTRAGDTIEITWRDTQDPIIIINGTQSTLEQAFTLVRSEPSFRDTLRIIGAFHEWTRSPWRNGDQYFRDGDNVIVTFTGDELIRTRLNHEDLEPDRDVLAVLRAPRGTTPLQRLNQHVAAVYENIPGDVIDKQFPECHVKIGTFEDGYSLWWSDMVANAFMEYRPTLSAALIRFAALMHCEEAEWSIVFVDAGEFEQAAQQFFGTATN